MKKTSILVVIILMLIFLATDVVADTLVKDDDTGGPLTDVNALYWGGSDFNGFNNDQLNKSNPVAEEAWLEALLGYAYDHGDIGYITKIEAGFGDLESDVKQLSD